MQSTIRRVAAVGLLFPILGLLAPKAQAEEGRIPIFEPTTISESGSYIVTRDITGAISIQAPAVDVQVDLNGFLVSGGIDADDLTTLAIRNGKTSGSTFDNTKQVTAENMTFTNQIYFTNIELYTIKNNRFLGSGANTIFISETAGVTIPATGTIENNVITNGSVVINTLATNRGINLLIRNNHLTVGSFWAFRILNQDSCEISGNRIRQHSGTGIELGGSHCRISDNVVSGCGGGGIRVIGSFNAIENNLSNENGQNGDAGFGSGIFVSGSRNHLEGNVTQDNQYGGVWIGGGTGNTYGRNISRGNVNNPGGPCANPAITNCAVPYGTGSAAPDLCDNGTGTTSLCDNLMPGPPQS